MNEWARKESTKKKESFIIQPGFLDRLQVSPYWKGRVKSISVGGLLDKTCKVKQ